MPDNDIHWQVFESDDHIAMFIQQSEEFVDQLQPKVSEAYGDQVINWKQKKSPKVWLLLRTSLIVKILEMTRGNSLQTKGIIPSSKSKMVGNSKLEKMFPNATRKGSSIFAMNT